MNVSTEIINKHFFFNCVVWECRSYVDLLIYNQAVISVEKKIIGLKA